MKKQQSGFTMIELIMVIVILGILAAFALPRFADFGKDARTATVEGLAGSIRSAAAIAHSAQLARNLGADASVELEGGVVVAMIGGYPTASATGIVTAIEMEGFDADTGGATATSKITFTPEGFTPASGDCNVSYTPTPAAGTDRVVTSVGGC